MKTILKIVGVIVMIGVIGYVGVCSYAMIKGTKGDSGLEPPSIAKAAWAVKVVATGNTYYTAKVESQGTIHTLYGYWEAVKGKYVFRNITLKLDEQNFGKIEIKRRELSK